MGRTINEFEKEFAADYAARINPDFSNELLHNAVPVLKHCGWKITRVAHGLAESVLPLNTETTNQHGTHQAALISLSADYTGGTALTSLLTGVPLAGVSKPAPEISASLWLASMDVKYISPSTGHLKGICKVPDNLKKKIVKRYFEGKRVLASLPIEFTSNGQKVATAELKYFVQPTRQLLVNSENPSALFKQKLKASARMIAGVRASKESKKIRVDCPHAAAAAGPHGALLAKKLSSASPQLTDMVLARTEHLDQTIRQMPNLEQVVMLGAGLDMRPFRFADRQIRFFEIDLPAMIEERERVIGDLNDPNREAVTRFSVTADFLKDDVAARVIEQTPFDPKLKTLFIYEGCSMYFSLEDNKRILKNIWQLAEHSESKIWCDIVSESVVNGQADRPEITEFLSQMDDLGESFVFGNDKPNELLEAIGCSSAKVTSCRQFLETDEPIFDEYRFCVGEPSSR